MPRNTPLELCIANLRGDYPPGAIGFMSMEEVLRELKQITGQDFGNDVLGWESWLRANPERVPNRAKTPQEALRILQSKPKPRKPT